LGSFGSLSVGRCCQTTAGFIGAKRSFIRAGHARWAEGGVRQGKGAWSGDAGRETALFALALREGSDAADLVTSLSRVCFHKGGVKGSKAIPMGCW